MSHIDEGSLHAYLDGALRQGDEDHAIVAAHLADCGDCRARLEEARDVRERAHALLRDVVPHAPRPAQDFAEVVERAHDGGRAAPRRAAWYRRPVGLAWAASLVVALGAGWLARTVVDGGELSRRAPIEARGGVATRAAAPPVTAESEIAAEADPAAPVEREEETARTATGALALQDVVVSGTAVAAERERDAITEPDRLRRARSEPERPATDAAPSGVAVPARADAAPAPDVGEPVASTPPIAAAPVPPVVAAAAATPEPERPDLSRGRLLQVEADVAITLDSPAPSWQRTNHGNAVRRFGAPLAGLAGVPVDSIRIAEDATGWSVRVAQTIDGQHLDLLLWRERSEPVERMEAEHEDQATHAVVLRTMAGPDVGSVVVVELPDGVRLSMTADMPLDSLLRLVPRLAPLP